MERKYYGLVRDKRKTKEGGDIISAGGKKGFLRLVRIRIKKI